MRKDREGGQRKQNEGEGGSMGDARGNAGRWRGSRRWRRRHALGRRGVHVFLSSPTALPFPYPPSLSLVLPPFTGPRRATVLPRSFPGPSQVLSRSFPGLSRLPGPSQVLPFPFPALPGRRRGQLWRRAGQAQGQAFALARRTCASRPEGHFL